MTLYLQVLDGSMEDPDLSLDAEEETQLLQVSAPSLVETLRVHLHLRFIRRELLRELLAK